MKSIRIFISALLVLALSFSLSGQTRTSYFVKKSTLRHNYNGAFAPDQGYVGIPALSNINVGMSSNMGVSSILFPLDNGKVGFFLNEGVDADRFLNSIEETSYLNGVVNFDIINAGWFSGKDSFWTLDLGVKTEINSSVPKEMFRFAKEGMKTSSQSYLIEQTSFGTDVYGQLSVGYSQGLDKLLKGLRIGGKLKVLFGLQSVSATIESMNIKMGADQWMATAIGNGYVLGGGLAFDKNNQGRIESVSFEPGQFAFAGMGAAIDLGVEYRISQGTPVDGLTFSLSVVDLGFISYFKNQSRVLTNDGGTFTYNGFQDIDFKDFDFSDQIEQLGKDFLDMVSFQEKPADGSQMKTLAAKVYAGVEYPFLKDKMSVGLIYSGRFGSFYNEHELTLAYNYAPVRWFDIAVSYSFLNSRQSIGWLVTFVPRKGLNVFLGSDYTCFSYAPIGLPLNKAYLDFSLGISVPLGGKNKRFIR